MDADIQIRIASPADSDAIASVLRDAFADFENFYTPGAFAATVISADEVRKRFGEGGIWIALKNEETVGTISVVAEGERLYIRSMAVSPRAQGFGAGRELLETAEKFALENGFEKLFLYTTPFLSSAIRLYEQNGFERRGDVDGFFGTALFEMEKKLNQPAPDGASLGKEGNF